ncbi:hypothetical protein [Halovenus salina]|uniref:hypothetical protein n=1 Tax=Halovenus salina TaxID=1510225 RepID=UPI002260D68C|nr:hypothetical protein [Halovenus salina]
MDKRHVTRRRLVAGGGTLVSGLLAGCLSESTDEQPTADNGNNDTTTPTEEDTATPTATESTSSETPSNNTSGQSDSTTDDLDIREANVVDVTVEANGSYRFAVTLHHDDDGEDGYANWWQVEQLDGTRLGRRELTHPHSTQPFTRATTIEIPETVSCVVVRGHDQTHGYGGTAALVTLDSQEQRIVDQGTEPQAFDTEDCP